jgi:MFS family permease
VDLNGHPFKVYPERWTTLAHFFVLQMTNSLLWVTFAPIADIAADFFGKDGFVGSLTAINLLAVLFLVLYPFGTVLASFAKKLYGLRVSLLIAAFFTVVGAFFRFIGVYVRNDVGGNWSYTLVFLGTAFAAIIQPIYINYPPTVSAIWFPMSERDIATSIGSMSNPLGNAIGTLIPVYIVRRTTVDNDNNYQVHGMATLMLVELIAVLVPLLFAWYSLIDSPPTPPSQSTSLKITELSVHSSDAIQSAASSGSSSSMAASSFSDSTEQSHVNPLLTPSRALNNQNSSHNKSCLHQQQSSSRSLLSQANFEHDLTEDEVTSFAVSPATSSSTSAQSAAANATSNIGTAAPREYARPSSFWNSSRFSVFAYADHGPIRSGQGSVWHDIQSLFRNKDFVILLVTMSLLLGMFSAFLTVLYQLISHYGYDNRDAGILGFVVIIAGLMGTIVVGFVMKKTHAYRSLLQGIVVAAVLFFIITMLVMVPDEFPGLVVCMILLGITLLPVLPVMMENCAEIGYPISEELSTGIVFSVSNVTGLIFIFIVQELIPKSHYHRVSPVAEVKVFMGVIILASAIIVLFYRGQYLRLQKDLTKRERAAAAAANESDRRSLGERMFQSLRRKSKSMSGQQVSEDDTENDEEENLSKNIPSPSKSKHQTSDIPISGSNTSSSQNTAFSVSPKSSVPTTLPTCNNNPNFASPREKSSFLTHASIVGTEDGSVLSTVDDNERQLSIVHTLDDEDNSSIV